MNNFRFKKKFGQNFLNNDSILQKIIDNVNCTDNNLIIEIGPGAGALTKYLKGLNKNLLLYEVDKDTKTYLKKLLDNKTKLIYKDFLEADIEKDISDFSYDKVSFIANIPYYITTPIVKKIISSNLNINEIVLMVQKEVAERFSAKCCSKKYNSLTIFLNYYFDIEQLFVVTKDNFTPMPNVDSAVVKLIPKKEKLDIKNEELFFSFINEAFTQKRKTLKNNIKNFNYEKIKKTLEKYHFSQSVRAEEIPIDIYVEIVNSLI